MTHSSTLDDLLGALETADGRLRALYRSLADDPSLAEQHEAEIRELHTTRRRLAESVGLAVLAERRTKLPKIDPASDAPPPSAVEPESVDAARAAEPPVVEPPVSDEKVVEWARAAADNGVGQASYADRFAATWEGSLEKLMGRLGPPRELDVELGDELDALDVVGQSPLVEEWASLPRDVQQTWLGVLVARTRAAKEIAGLSSAQRARIKTIISRYPPWAAEYHPGHVHGMRLDHEPVHGTWARDARELWTSLNSLLDRPEPTSRRSTTRKKRPDDEPDVDEPSVRTLDAAWPLHSLVRGRHVVLVGGDPREPNRKRLQELFELGSLDWPDVSGPRKVDALVSRIRRRGIDIVVVLRGFIDHRQSEPILAAAKEAQVPWALADGYGATAIKAGLERFLAPPR